MTTGRSLDELLAEIDGLAASAPRLVVGLCGPPGVGKSTVADLLTDRLGERATVLGMDGFHLADEVLAELGLSDVKGAPETFDPDGFVQLLDRVRSAIDRPVYAPSFDRSIEAAVAGSVAIRPEHRVVIVEGNYLLMEGAWAPVRPLLDLTVYLQLDGEERRRRLIERHIRHGRSRDAAIEWVDRSDEANARRIAATAGLADRRLDFDSNH
ncbi:MAG: nucleoside/nucleotide kinase family protein [Acidimicrobiales bacterium]